MSEQETSIINLEILMSGTTELRDELYGLLARQLPHTLHALNQAFAKQQYNIVEEHLHKLQGTCAYCGLERLQATAKTVSESLKKNSTLSSGEMEKLNTAFHEVLGELERLGYK